MKTQRTSVILLVALWMASAWGVSADILWKFSTTGEGQTISGTLTTDGVESELSAARNFNINSIQSLLLNGEPVSNLVTPLPWVHGSSGDVSTGPLIWDGTQVILPIFILATSSGGDLVEIDNNPDPDFPNFRARIQDVVEFTTSSTVITPERKATTRLIDFGFDEGVGTTVTDSINSLSGAPSNLNNAPTFNADSPSGKSGDYSVRFAAGQYFLVNDPDTRLQLDQGNPAFTLQAWVKPSEGNLPGRQVFYYANGPGGALSFSVNNNRTVFVTTLGIADVSSSAAIPDDGAWHHIAVVHVPGVELRFYVDGVLGDTRPYTGGVNFSRTQKLFSIGAEWNGALQYVGSVDRLKVTSGMLAAEDLDFKAVPPTPLIDFGFDEGSGTTVTDSVNSLIGAPSNLNNAPTFEADAPSGQVGDSSVRFEAGQFYIVNDPDTRLQLDSANPEFTLQAWVKPSPGNLPGRQVFYYANGPGGAISFSVNNNRTVFVTTLGIADVSSGAVIPDDGAWHHIAVVHQPGVELRFYVDGVLGDTRPYTSGVNFSRTQKIFSIGAEWNGALQYIGSVDRLKVTSGILSASQLDYQLVPTGGSGLVIGRPSVTTLGFGIGVTDSGGSILDPATIVLTLDGTVVTATSVAKTGTTTSINYASVIPLPSGSSHTVTITVKDTKGKTFSKTETFLTPEYATLPELAALPETAVDPANRGFRIRTYQIASGTREGTIAYNESILVGDLGENVANLDDAGGVDAEGYFNWADYISFDTTGGANGFFNPPDFRSPQFPGIPGTTSSVTDFALEILAAIDFKTAGIYTMAVNTDWTGFPNASDGYQVRAGVNPLDPADSVVLGFFDALAGVGESGVANSPFQFYVPKPGIYPFRLLYYQTSGSANLEWYMLNADGVRTLINDPDSDLSLAAYSRWTVPPKTPLVGIGYGVGTTLLVTFSNGRLESAPSVNGPWTEVPNATSPYAVTPSPGQAFFRAVQ